MKDLDTSLLILLNSQDKKILEAEAERNFLPLSSYARFKLLKNLKDGKDDEKTI